MSNRVPDPVDKLAIFVVGDFSIIHEEPDDGYCQWPLHETIEDVLICLPDVKSGAWYVLHPIWIDTRVLGAVSDAYQLPSLFGTAGTEHTSHNHYGQC